MKNKPNVIYILADDMGYGDVSYLNHDAAFTTPNFDRLAKEGIAFTDAHASSAVCTPSRYSILTGRYNFRSKLKQGVLFGYDQPLIEDDRQTVANIFKEKGYKTGCVGKWHLGLGWNLHSENLEDVDFSRDLNKSPIDYGFDYYYGISASLDMPPYVYINNHSIVEEPDHITKGEGKAFFREGPTAPNFVHENVLPELTKKSLEFIDDNKEDPFFLYFPLPAPHTPILPTKEFIGKSNTNAYGDFVLMCDDVIGQILDKLDELNLKDNTLIIYTSDNGCSPMADFDELKEKGHNPSYIFRGHKADIYEGGHRIPLLMRWPEMIKPNSFCDQTVCLCDFTATIASLLDYKIPDNMAEDSYDMSILLSNPDYKEPIREATIHHSVGGFFSIRKGEWKLELCLGSGGWSYPREEEAISLGLKNFQLYNLKNDIGETKNVIEENEDVANELKNLLTKYVKEGRSTKGSPQKNTGISNWPQLNWL